MVMKRAFFVLLTVALAGQTAPKRPRILGVAHISVYVSDLVKARVFYKDFLGFDEPYVLKRDDGSESLVAIKVNENQYIELSAGPPVRGDGQLSHFSFYTDNAAGLREYLASRGVKVPDKLTKGRMGNTNFNIADPDGHVVEIYQYEPDGWTRREQGKFMPATRISTRILHVGFLTGPLERATKFYRDTLGFEEFWRGSSNGQDLSWVNMRVPDGDDYVEFMLYRELPDQTHRGTQNHVCLMVPDLDKAVAELESRRARTHYERPMEIRTGVNRKRQVNLYDPDGTRIELMEPQTVDGKPAASSTAPPPQPE
jgi:catechol 2,3-dioxygenase-like lactoylglutathione lyase family enzyme